MREPSVSGLAHLAALQHSLLAIVAGHEGDCGLGIYRRLVHANLLHALNAQLPLTCAELGPGLPRLVSDFCAEELPRSPVLRDVAFELVRWAEPRWRADALVPAWLGALARAELLEFDCHTAVREPPPLASTTLDPLLPVAFDATCRLACLDHRVLDRLTGTLPAGELRAEPHGVVFHRGLDNEVHSLPVSATDASVLVELLVFERPLAEGVRRGLAAAGASLSEASLGAVARTLEELFERGILLGSRERATTGEEAGAPWPVSWRDLVRPRP
ncbi:MAG: putative DNA-binding domain-containing protein [Deltaproteobacteria bacterium]|nr:putative DNA-binding domain-containing protein [Deltaproteobacteria bacterium]